jgi:phage gp46-like protein
MPDIRLVQNTAFPAYSVTEDWNLLWYGALDYRQALATAVMVALGTDGLAYPADVLPDPDSTDRRGWWGDLDAAEIWNGWPIGSRLWLLERAKILPPEAREGATVVNVQNYIAEALQPFVDRGICSTFTVNAWRHDIDSIYAVVRIYRGPLMEVELQFQILWDEYPIKSLPDEGYNPGRKQLAPW